MDQRTYVQCDDNGKVFAISGINCDLIKVPEYNDNLIGATYDLETGEFTGYRVTLSSEKTRVRPGETAKLTITVLDWDQKPSDYAGEFILRVGQAREVVEIVGGFGTYTLTIDEPGTVTVTTPEEGFINTASVTITAEGSDE